MDKIKDNNLIRHGSYINGEWHTNDTTFVVTNPATQQPITTVSNAGVIETNLAIHSAKLALKLN
jgi:succinate-semialdehyde dehydrogenase/glutarate-semialdehyde dehydrogenase